MCRAGGMCAAQEVFCGVCAAQEVIMFCVGGLCGVCAAAGLYLWATVYLSHCKCSIFYVRSAFLLLQCRHHVHQYLIG